MNVKPVFKSPPARWRPLHCRLFIRTCSTLQKGRFQLSIRKKVLGSPSVCTGSFFPFFETRPLSPHI